MVMLVIFSIGNNSNIDDGVGEGEVRLCYFFVDVICERSLTGYRLPILSHPFKEDCHFCSALQGGPLWGGAGGHKTPY